MPDVFFLSLICFISFSFYWTITPNMPSLKWFVIAFIAASLSGPIIALIGHETLNSAFLRFCGTGIGWLSAYLLVKVIIPRITQRTEEKPKRKNAEVNLNGVDYIVVKEKRKHTSKK